jgi:hypothetical protein
MNDIIAFMLLSFILGGEAFLTAHRQGWLENERG